MTQVFINSKSQTITSSYRDGCCHHHEDRYLYQAGRRLHVYEWDEYLTADNCLETSVGRLIDGKMHYKVKRVKQRQQWLVSRQLLQPFLTAHVIYVDLNRDSAPTHCSKPRLRPTLPVNTGCPQAYISDSQEDCCYAGSQATRWIPLGIVGHGDLGCRVDASRP